MHKFTIDSKAIYDLLKEKEVEHFHHANTAKTSVTFIKEDALLSRKYIESNNLTQTEQYTDEKDKELQIWDFVFLDGTDLHKKFNRRNNYGPILFHISLDILLDENFKKIKVTKSNPANWKPSNPQFYDSINEIKKDYLVGDRFQDGGIMFLFEKPEKKILLSKYCTKIIVDNPKIIVKDSENVTKSVSELVKLTIQKELTAANLPNINVEIRHANGKSCNCFLQYNHMLPRRQLDFDKLFAQ